MSTTDQTTAASSSVPAPTAELPLVIVGGGPIGLAAAAHAQSRGLPTVILEAGAAAGASVREWAHVRLFSTWSELVDPAAEKLLAPTGWVAPDPQGYPTGADWVERYLAPLAAALDETEEVEVRYDSRVVGVARFGRDRLVAVDREGLPFTVHVEHADGTRTRLAAAAVVDASGTWTRPNPLGGDGYPAAGEAEHSDHITYGIPDFSSSDVAARYAGKLVAVVGSGASAQNVLVGLGALAEQHPGTRVTWLLRRPGVGDAFGGGDNDQLAERGALGLRAKDAVTHGPVSVVTSFRTSEVTADPGGNAGQLRLTSFPEVVGGPEKVVHGVDEIIVVTGFAPDHTWLRQVQLDLDSELDAPAQLAGEIHPAWHSCGSVSPHGADRLRQPETGLYLAGMKSYGRAPSFLALTGFEQVRSIVAEVAGDHEAAARVELVLPDTGVCHGSGLFDGEPPVESGGGCCGPVAAEPAVITSGAAAAQSTWSVPSGDTGGCGPSFG